MVKPFRESSLDKYQALHNINGLFLWVPPPPHTHTHNYIFEGCADLGAVLTVDSLKTQTLEIYIMSENMTSVYLFTCPWQGRPGSSKWWLPGRRQKLLVTTWILLPLQDPPVRTPRGPFYRWEEECWYLKLITGQPIISQRVYMEKGRRENRHGYQVRHTSIFHLSTSHPPEKAHQLVL